MAKIPFIQFDWRRSVARSAELSTKNRYFEQNPSLNDDLSSLLARPGLRKAIEVGDGPIRHLYSAPGAFNDSLFAVSGRYLYQVYNNGASTQIGQIGTNVLSAVSMAATGTLGDVPNYLYIADGGILWCYTEDGFSRGQLTTSGGIANTDTVTIGTTYYQFTSGSVDTGTPNGTVGTPWLVALGSNDADAIENLAQAINATGTAGTQYSTALVANPDANAFNWTGTVLYVRANEPGTVGDSIATAETGASLSWASATLADGGTASLVQVPLPDSLGCISVAHINGYVVVVPAQDQGVNGRFYWINPGENTIDPLDFATAERSPDAILQVKVFSDQVLFLGQDTTETWITTGNPDAPFQRFEGVLFDRGIWEGTAVQIKESIVVVDKNGAVLQIGGGIKPISNPAIEERIRKAIQIEEAS